MKRIAIALLLLIVAIPLLVNILPEKGLAAAGELIIHKRIFRDVDAPDSRIYENDGLPIAAAESSALLQDTLPLNGVNFDVYDASTLYQQSGMDARTFVTQYSSMSRREGLAAAKASLPLVTQVKTTYDARLNEDGIARIPVSSITAVRAYFILETSIDRSSKLNVDIERRSSPMMVVLPMADPITGTALQDVHLYPKNVGYVRDPYFFKYGKNQDGSQQPLKGVVFALYRLDEKGQKLYLDLSPVNDLQNNWIASEQPLSDAQVYKFVSDATGLIQMEGRFLASGTYYFEELSSVEGYTMDEASKAVKVEVPDSWEDEAGNFRPVLLNGQPLEELISGEVPAATKAAAEPKIYNNQQVKQPAIQEETTPKNGFRLPKTNEVKATVSLAGILVMIAALYLWRKKQERNEGNKHT